MWLSDQIKRSIYYELFALAHNEEANTVYKDKNNAYINVLFEQLAN
jgi:hypothetical protein